MECPIMIINICFFFNELHSNKFSWIEKGIIFLFSTAAVLLPLTKNASEAFTYYILQVSLIANKTNPKIQLLCKFPKIKWGEINQNQPFATIARPLSKIKSALHTYSNFLN